MEGGPSNGACSMISFGDNSRELFSVALMNPSAASSRNALLPCLPLSNSSHQITDSQNMSAAMLNEFNSLKAGSRFMENNSCSDHPDSSSSYSMRAKIMAHPYFPRLLAAYVNCQKVGAPPEVVARLEHVCSSEAPPGGGSGTTCLGDDPSLDQFMEAYCEMLIKYEEELTKPIKEAVIFLKRIESQFKALTVAASNSVCDDISGRNVCSGEEVVNAMENCIDPQAEDQELKGQLLRRYSGYLGSLKQEFLKKKKKGKLPKEARQQLLEWWSRHYKWPYPSESQKLALAESTGLDQKQINNWFINQRKRHWKPTEDMQFVVMDATCSPYYLENMVGNHFPMDCTFPHH